MGVASLVLGILSLVFYGTIAIMSAIFALLSIIFGGIAIGTKKRKGLGIAGIILSLLLIFILIGNIDTINFNIMDNNLYKNTLEQENIEPKEIYNKNNIIIKITDYQYDNITGNLKVNLYIENNTSQDLTFTIDGSVTLNDYSVDTYFYKEVNSETKSNESFVLRNLDNNNIKKEDLSIMKFNLDIYHSENYYIDNRIEDNLEIVYEFQ